MHKCRGRRRGQQDEYKGEIEDSNLIQCIRKRPALYNYQLDPEKRRRVDVAAGWIDVAKELGGKLSVEECRKRWRSLRDTYHQYRLRGKKKKLSLEKWKHSQELSFLTDIYRPKLKSERSKYIEKCKALQKDDDHSIECKTDESLQNTEEIYLVESFDEGESDSFEHIIEEAKKYDVVTAGDISIVGVNNVYNEVCIYDDNTMDSHKQANHTNVKSNTILITDVALEKRENDFTKTAEPNTNIINDELDLFFKFLKTKMQKLPAGDITEIQIEFLNAVLSKEMARSRKN